MPSLPELQRVFGAALLDSAPASPRMAVYRANVHGNWSKALAGAYPVVQKIVGGGFFEAMARDYAHAHPSVSGDLNEYGARLAGFLGSFPRTQDLPYLPDVARMEWLAHRACYAADAAPFDFSRPTEVRLAPGCALLESAWPLGRLWDAHQDGREGEGVALDSGPDRILVHRPVWRVEVVSLSPGDYCFLDRLRAGAALGEALGAASACDPGFVAKIALAAWVHAGVLTQ